MTRLVRFARWPKRQPKPPRRQGRLRDAPWPPLAALVGVAAVLWLAAGLHPERHGRARRPRADRRRPPRDHASGSFTLCARARRPNCVVDGDTIRVAGIKIRLEDIDAPEVFLPEMRLRARPRQPRDGAPPGARSTKAPSI